MKKKELKTTLMMESEVFTNKEINHNEFYKLIDEAIDRELKLAGRKIVKNSKVMVTVEVDTEEE